jgi:hypothetical protein
MARTILISGSNEKSLSSNHANALDEMRLPFKLLKLF